MALDVLTLAVANSYTDDSVEGYGVQKGRNCQIASKEAIEDGTRITFAWYDDDDNVRLTTTVDVINGKDGDKGDDGATPVDARRDGDALYLIMSDGSEVYCGDVLTVKGEDGVSPTITVKTNTPNEYVLHVTTKDSSFDTPNLKGSGASDLTADLTTAIAVGGINSGTTYEAGTPLETLFRDLLEPTLYPSFTAPSASLSYGASTYYAVGGTVSALQATVTLNRGAINPAYGTNGYRAGTATGFSISTSGADTEYTASSDNSGVFNVSALTRATKGTIVITGTANYNAGEQPKDSKGNNYNSALPAGSVTASKTLTFIQPYYYGASNSSTIADFTGLTASVTAKGQKTFNYTTNNQYMVFAYDSSYGNIKTILDGNGFDVTDGWQKSTVTVNGFSYYVYVSKSPTTDTNAPFTFKY